MTAEGSGPVFAAVADRLLSLRLDHPRRVAVDGITAAGKTTFADGLAGELRRRDVAVLRVSMDGFHHPRAVRYRQGRASADGYYEDAYDVASLRSGLLDPLGPDGDRRYRPAVIDLAADTRVDIVDGPIDPSTVLVVDGSFLQKPSVRDGWDFVVFLRTSFEAAASRGVARDAELLGGTETAAQTFRDRYHAAQRRYLAECDPESAADVVIDVEDPAQPALSR